MPNLCALSAASALRSAVGATTLRERSTPGSPPSRADITSENDSNSAASPAVTALLCTARRRGLQARAQSRSCVHAAPPASASTKKNFREHGSVSVGLYEAL